MKQKACYQYRTGPQFLICSHQGSENKALTESRFRNGRLHQRWHTQIPGSVSSQGTGRRGRRGCVCVCVQSELGTYMCMMSVSCKGSCLTCGLTMAGWGIPVAWGPGGPGTMWCENLQEEQTGLLKRTTADSSMKRVR